VSKIINKGIDEMESHRVYIPKGQKGFRPLGVPEPEWRLLLHMYSNFLTFFLKDKFPHQHGFIPGLGTLTAWKEIFEKGYIHQDFIKEWDFKSFFDKVHLNRITEILLNLGCPKHVVYFLENINRSHVKLPKEELLDESQEREKQKSHQDIKEGVLNATQKMFEPIKEFLAANSPPEDPLAGFRLLNQFMEEDESESIQEYLQLQWALFDSFKPAKIPTQFEGVAQGSPTSPILANLIMNIWISKNIEEGHNIVAYADDSVTFSDKPIKLECPSDTGCIINQEKSGYVKYNKIWIKPLIFLGLKFDGEKFSANTRKGSKLELSDKMKFLLEMLNEISNKRGLYSWDDVLKYVESPDAGYYKDNAESWENLFRSKLIGFIQSRLYSGNWNLEDMTQDFNMKFVNNSWMDTKLNPGIKSVFIGSSYAIHSLCNILRYNSKLRKPRRPSYRFIKTKTIHK